MKHVGMTPIKILIVEDNYQLRSAMTRMLDLSYKNLVIDWVGTAEEAEKKILEQKFDLFLVDYTLGGLKSGLDVWKKESERLPSNTVYHDFRTSGRRLSFERFWVEVGPPFSAETIF